MHPLSPRPVLLHSNPYGVRPPQLKTRTQVQIAQDLGAGWFRPNDLFLYSDTSVAEVADRVAQAQAAGLRVILTVRAAENRHSPAVPPITPSQIRAYQDRLRSVLIRLRPAVLVVENEMNWEHFWKGTPEQYLAQLKAAAAVAYELGILCADGGLASGAIAAATAADLVNRARGYEARERAARFGRACFEWEGVESFDDLVDLLEFGEGPEKVERVVAIVDGLSGAGVDYANFHWYVTDSWALRIAMRYLRRATGGMALLTNEIGAQGKHMDEKPEAVTDLLVGARAGGAKVICWFSVDMEDGAHGGSRSLVDENGELRPTGRAFRRVATGVPLGVYHDLGAR